MLIYFSLNDVLSAILAILAASLALLTSNFARQAILIPSFFISMIMLDITMIAFVFISFILASLLQGKRFLRSLKFQLLHLKIYQKKFTKSSFQKGSLSSYVKISDLKEFIFRPKKKFGKVFFKEPFRGILFIPEILLMIPIWYFSIDQNEIAKYSSIFIVAIYFTYLLVSTEKLNFIGESYRYIEYSTYFLYPFILGYSLIFSKLPETLFWFLIIPYSLYLLIFILFYIILFKKQSENYTTDLLKNIINIMKFNKNHKILPIPLRLTLDICARSKAQGIWWQPGNLTETVQQEYLEEYPYPSKDLQKIIDRHGITHILVQKKALEAIHWTYPLADYQYLCEDDNFIVYST